MNFIMSRAISSLRRVPMSPVSGSIRAALQKFKMPAYCRTLEAIYWLPADPSGFFRITCPRKSTTVNSVHQVRLHFNGDVAYPSNNVIGKSLAFFDHDD